MLVVIRNHPWWTVSSLCFAIIATLSAWALHDELRTSERQAQLIAAEATGHYHWLEAGGDTLQPEAPDGPLDRRRGYTRLPEWLDRLEEQHFETTWRAAVSPPVIDAAERGLYPLYDPRSRAGLTILGRDGDVLHKHRTPTEVVDTFEDLPTLLIDTLLFIENRELLEPGYDHRNPAVEWKRLLHAAAALAGNELGITSDHFGGSTLATQLEKFRHSPGGITDDEAEKFQQMATAALRAYRHGPKTIDHQRQIVVDYINGVPLAASPGYGEVEGLFDGLRIWFGAKPSDVIGDLRLLQRASSAIDVADEAQSLEAARSYRMVLSLFLAHRRPTHYLVHNPDALHELTDAYTRIMAEADLIGDALRDAVLSAETPIQPPSPRAMRPDFTQRKAVDAVRASLLDTLDVDNVYQLDRHDLFVQSTIDAAAQRGVDEQLAKMTDIDALEEQDLLGHRLLNADDPIEKLTFSFTLFERTDSGNALRVLADNHDGPLNINEHVKLDLGSTAKLRTLVTYLDVIERLYRELRVESPQTLEEISASAPDSLRRWVAGRLADDPGVSSQQIVDAAMDRHYSANPNQNFFTGGGQHRFSNFEHRRNHTQSVSEAFRHSVNLVFIRMMRDISDYFIWLDPQRVNSLLGDEDSDERTRILARFADFEGQYFQQEFHDRYAELDPESIPEAIVENRNLSAESHAMVALVFQDATPETMHRFVVDHTGTEQDESTVEQWWARYHRDALNWQDRGYLTGIHPLELWTAAWLYANPDSSRSETMVASRQVRQEVYQWLFRTSHRSRQDRRIRQMLEREAFDQIHHSWRQTGYPFDELVPSLATSIGSSADRPLALAELVGIIANDGVRQSNYRVDGIIAAPDTPYEARLERTGDEGQRVLPVAVARTVRDALVDVVEAGTARRIAGDLLDSDGNPLTVGGKTGTGDHDRQIFEHHRLVETRHVHRTATLAFLIDERFFGTLTVFVSGESAGDFNFTSALPTTVLRVLYPAFGHLMEEASTAADPGQAATAGITDPEQPLALTAMGREAQQPGLPAPPGTGQPGSPDVSDRQLLDWKTLLDDDPPTLPVPRTLPEARQSQRLPLDWESLLPPPAPVTIDDRDHSPAQAPLTPAPSIPG